MIDDKYKYIFIENPKTASYSIKHALMGEENVHNPLDSRMATINHDIPHIIKSKYPEKWSTYTSFVVVRNTWDRARSFFMFYRNNANSDSYQSISFDEWVKLGCPPPKENHLISSIHNQIQDKEMLCQLKYIEDVDKIIILHSFDDNERANELQKGINKIAKSINIPTHPIPVKNKTLKKETKFIWTKESIEHIKEKYQKEIEMFDFKPPVISR